MTNRAAGERSASSVLSVLATDCATVLKAADAVAARSGWWSCCELGLPDPLVDSIRSSLRQLSPWELRQLLGNENACALADALPARWRERFRWSDLLVLPLLVCMSEALRSTYRGGALYEHVAPKIGVEGQARTELFVGGQPTAAFKMAMRTTPPRLRMRHHFQEEDDCREFGKPWYRLIWLQSGPGRYHLLEQTGRIDPQGSVTSRSLAGLDGHGQRSDTFVQLVHELQRLRGLFADPSESRSILSRNPWIRPEWVDQLIERATARHIALVDELTEAAEFHIDEVSDRPLVALDHLAVTTEGKVFALLNLLPELASRCRGADEPLLRIARHEECRLIRMEGDGNLAPDPQHTFPVEEREPHQIVVNLAQSVLLSVEDEEGKLLVNAEVELWPSRVAVAPFDLDGRSIKVDEDVQPSMLVVRRGLRIDPADVEISRAHLGEWELVQLGLVLHSPVRVFDDDLLLWSWGVGGDRADVRHEAEVFSRGSIHHPGHPPRIGEEVQLAVRPRVAGDVVLAMRTSDGHRARFEARAGQRVFSYRMPGDRTTEDVSLHVLLDSRGSPQVSRVNVPLHAVGAVQVGAGGRTRLGREAELNRTQAVASAIELGCDPHDASAHGCWVIVEGERYVGRAMECGGTFRAPTLIGLGEALVARPGPFNPPPGADLTVAAAVMDNGAAVPADLADQSREPQRHIDMDRPLRLDDVQRLVILHADGRIRFEAPTAVGETEGGHRWISAVRDAADPAVIGIAAAVRGERVGAIWDNGWEASLQVPSSAAEVKRLVQLLLWFRLPVARYSARAFWARLTREHLVATLSALLQPQDLLFPEAGSRLGASPRGASAIARLVLRLAGGAVHEHASEIVDAFGGDPVAVVRQLSWIEPAAAARTAIGFSYANVSRNTAMQQAGLLIAAATGILSDDHFDRSVLRCGQALRRLQNSLHERFLESVIDAIARQATGKTCTPAELHNIGISISAAPEVCAPVTFGVFHRLALTAT